MMENFLSFIEIVRWPATVIFAVWYLRDHVEKVVLKHDGSALELTTKEIEENKRKADKETEHLEKLLDTLEPDNETEEARKELRSLKQSIESLYRAVKKNSNSSS